MGIDMAICETESPLALCRDYKLKIVKIHVKEGEFDEYQGHNCVVSLKDAEKAVGDLAAFMKRNRIKEESDAIYMDLVKNEKDAAVLKPLAKKIPTGWVDTNGLDEKTVKNIYEKSIKDDAVTGWTLLGFDEMADVCAKCKLSWDKGRGCIGTFGPNTTELPKIAEKAGCPITASAPDAAFTGKVFTVEDARKLLDEVGKLRPALEADSKQAVRRYSGPVDRLEAMAKACIEGKCGFKFI